MARYWWIAYSGVILSVFSLGCVHTGGSLEDRYRNWVDPAWPYRYNYAARQAVVAPFAQQALNGQFLNQTVWNWHFESGTDRLNGAGIEKLNSLARATPQPETRIYLQTARDIPPTAENLEKLAALRDDLNARRAAAIKKYMASQLGGGVEIEVYVHDAPPPGMPARFGTRAFTLSAGGYQGGITGGLGGAGMGVGGTAAGGVGLTTGGGAMPAGTGQTPAPTGR
ncbi:MAG: hypothetical protein NZ703_06365 [Gemmataceae bacterium]|nr:hypothetical protein [Gemmataceae bacterium]